MKLNKILVCLTESKIDIEEYKQKVGSTIPPTTLDKLAAKMKGGKYDNIALAILKKVQEERAAGKHYTGESRVFFDFLKEHPNVVYSALKKAARNNSKFNPEEFIDFSINFAHSKYDSPKRYWYSVYSADTPKMTKENKDSKNFLKGHKVKNLEQEILVFPNTYKKDNEYGLTDDDLDKQWEDIKNLSAKMAALDDSGETYEEDDDIKKATDNHWCVASSDNQYYKDYKNDGGVFVIVVKKKPDGTIDWNKRYLYYTDAGANGGENIEFADKFDRHGVDIEDVLSPDAISILEKIEPTGNKREQQNWHAENRAYQAYNDYAENSHTKGGKEWDAFKLFIKTVNDWMDKQNEIIKKRGEFTYSDLRKTIIKIYNQINPKNYEGLVKFFSKGKNRQSKYFDANKYSYRYDIGNYSFFAEKLYHNWLLSIMARVQSVGRLRTIERFESSDGPDKVWRQFVHWASTLSTYGDKPIDKDFYEDRFFRHIDFDSERRYFKAKSDYKADENILRGNKNITNKYLKIRKEHDHTYIIVSQVDLKIEERDGKYIIIYLDNGRGYGKEVSDLLDPDMPKKVVDCLNKNVADGPAELPF